jgi:hypothetical protein
MSALRLLSDAQSIKAGKAFVRAAMTHGELLAVDQAFT